MSIEGDGPEGMENMERETRVELATSTLARSRSTTELLPLNQKYCNIARKRGHGPRVRELPPRPARLRSSSPRDPASQFGSCAPVRRGPVPPWAWHFHRSSSGLA